MNEGGAGSQASLTITSRSYSKQAQLTAGDGTFTFTSLPAGTYSICGGMLPRTTPADPPTADRPLDSCAWPSYAISNITLAAGQLKSGVKVPLRQGRLLRIQVNDPTSRLAASVSRNSGPELWLRIAGPDGIFHHIPIITETPGARIHAVVVPYNDVHNLFVQSTRFHLTDENSKEYSGPVSMQWRHGASDKPTVVSVGGAK